VRVVSADGEQLGILPIAQALELARQREMDLVEVAAEAQPPVCRIMDFGKYKYMQARRQKDARKKQTIIQVKEVKLGPKTDTHDFDFKAKHVRRFLEEGNKAKVTVRFKARWPTPSLGWKMLNKMVEARDMVIENHPRMEGRMLSMILPPKPHCGGGQLGPCLTPLPSRGERGMRKGQHHMPKMKTKRAAAKRLKRTASGLLKRSRGWKRHKLEGKRPKRKRRLGKAVLVAKVDEPRLKRLVPYL
jgi:translation initiation factor IF-3